MAQVTGQKWRSEIGAELIEFALVFPLFMLMVAAILDFGMLLRTYEVIVNAAREGARVAVLDGYSGDADPATTDDVTVRVQQYLDASGVAGPVTVTTTDVERSTPAGTFDARQVTVSYTYDLVPLTMFNGFDWWGSGASANTFGSLSLQAVSEMRTEIQATAP